MKGHIIPVIGIWMFPILKLKEIGLELDISIFVW